MKTGVALTALIAAAALTACGGGGQTTSVPAATATSAPTSAPAGTQPTSGVRVTLTIDRTKHTKTKASSRSVAAGLSRSPQYLSGNVAGVQVTVSSGTSTRTIYADLSSSSSLCMTASNSSYLATCAVIVPTLGTSETITATEVDLTPTAATNGYGTGFADNANILAVGHGNVTTTAGTISNLTLALDPVAGTWYDCGLQTSSASIGEDGGHGTMNAGRIVVTAGVPSSTNVEPEFGDITDGWWDGDTTPLPFVDVDGTPVPLTVTSSSQHVTVFPFPNNGATPPPSPNYTQTASIPNDGYEWANCYFLVGLKYDGQSTAPSTLTVANNLTASPQFKTGISGGQPYASSMVYTIVPVSASPAAVTVTVTGNVTATVTGSDYKATGGMTVASACTGTGSATIASAANINTTSWTQQFVVTPVSAGTCTFTLRDSHTSVLTTPITVTVNP